MGFYMAIKFWGEKQDEHFVHAHVLKDNSTEMHYPFLNLFRSSNISGVCVHLGGASRLTFHISIAKWTTWQVL